MNIAAYNKETKTVMGEKGPTLEDLGWGVGFEELGAKPQGKQQEGSKCRQSDIASVIPNPKRIALRTESYAKHFLTS